MRERIEIRLRDTKSLVVVIEKAGDRAIGVEVWCEHRGFGQQEHLVFARKATSP